MFQPTLAVINKKKLGLPKSLTGLLCEGVCGVCVAHGGHLKIPKEVSLFSLFSKRHLKYQRKVLTASDDAAKKKLGWACFSGPRCGTENPQWNCRETPPVFSRGEISVSRCVSRRLGPSLFGSICARVVPSVDTRGAGACAPRVCASISRGRGPSSCTALGNMGPDPIARAEDALRRYRVKPKTVPLLLPSVSPPRLSSFPRHPSFRLIPPSLLGRAPSFLPPPPLSSLP